MWRKVVEEWSFKKTLLYNEKGDIVAEEDQEAWAERTISEEEVEAGTEL